MAHIYRLSFETGLKYEYQAELSWYFVIMVPQSGFRYEREPQSPLVDVVIPYYNGFDYLKLAIASVLAQSFRNFRLIVIDDCTSDDRAEKYIQELNDSRIIYTYNSVNLGLQGNFEKSRLSISAKWGVILGHDDLLLPEYLKEMLAGAEKFPSSGIIQPLVNVINDKGVVINTLVDTAKKLIRSLTIFLANFRRLNSWRNKDTLVQSEMAIKAIMVGDFLYFPTLMWKNEFLSKHEFRQDLYVTLDIEIIINLLNSGADLLLVGKPLAKYRRHSASKSGIPEHRFTRLEEESNLYKEFSRRFTDDKHLKMLSWLHLSTRMYALLESAKAASQFKFQLAVKFLILAFT
jgi:glycosyltransferase involved in cell wall biosynthesis